MNGSDKKNDNKIHKVEANEPIWHRHEITEERNKQQNQKWGTRCLCAHTIARAKNLCWLVSLQTVKHVACMNFESGWMLLLLLLLSLLHIIWNYDTIVAHWKFIDAVVLHSSYHNKFIINAETFWLLKMHFATASTSNCVWVYARVCAHRSCINFLPFMKCACRHDGKINGIVLLLILYFILILFSFFCCQWRTVFRVFPLYFLIIQFQVSMHSHSRIAGVRRLNKLIDKLN